MIFTEAWAADLEPLVEQVRVKEQRFVGYEIETTLPKRGLLNLTLSLSPLKDDNGVGQGVAIVVNDLTEKKRLQAVREMFRRYVSPIVVDRLPADANELRLGGHRQEISVLFADLRGFTALGESLDPEDLVVVLNQYLSLAAQAVLTHEGTLDKFMGDAVMAIFNAPLPQDDHPLRAVRAALAIDRQSPIFIANRARTSLTCTSDSINTGESVVGNVDTAQMNYTTIGDTVNLAKRLQELASGVKFAEPERLRPSCRVRNRQNTRAIQVRGRKSRTAVRTH